MTTIERDYHEIDVSSREFWLLTPAERDERWQALRRERPVSWQRPAEDGTGTRAEIGGFWAVTGHAQCYRLFRRPAEFSSAKGIYLEDVPDEVRIASSFLAMDAPDHKKLRRLVSVAFTPARIAELEDFATELAKRAVDDLLAEGPGDFVTQISGAVPVPLIAEMIGLEADEMPWFVEKVDDWLDWNGPGKTEKYDVEIPAEVMVKALAELAAALATLIAERRRNPKPGFVNDLIDAEIDGERLKDDEIVNFLTLLTAAGTDTTSHAISHAMIALTEFPDERRRLAADFDSLGDTAVHEMLRWANVTPSIRRTATTEFTVDSEEIHPGEKVVLFTASANRDETVFDEPWRFDVTRDPNPHLSLGGGPHRCLGAALGPMEMKVTFRELLTRLPDIEAGAFEYSDSSHVSGVRSLECSF